MLEFTSDAILQTKRDTERVRSDPGHGTNVAFLVFYNRSSHDPETDKRLRTELATAQVATRIVPKTRHKHVVQLSKWDNPHKRLLTI